MSSTNYCEVQRRLDVLSLIEQNVFDSASPSLTNEVKKSAEIITQSIHSNIIKIAATIISLEITNETYKKETDGYRATLAIYKFDENLFERVIHKVFDDIVEDDNFKKIMEALKKLEDNETKVYTFCKLYSFISRIYENLYAFECAVNILLKDKHLKPQEKDKLKELLKKLEKCSSDYLRASSLASSMEYDY